MRKLLSIFIGMFKLIGYIANRLERARIRKEVENEMEAKTLEKVKEGNEARNDLTDPDTANELLGEIVITSGSNRQFLPELPSGVPESDGSSVDYKGRTWQLRNLETLVYPLSARDIKTLGSCHPELQFLVRELAMFFALRVLCGIRKNEKQQKAYDEGRSKLKPGESKHNRDPSDAVDICPIDAPAAWAEGTDLPRSRYDEVAEVALKIAKANDIELRWGGDWDGDGDTSDQTFNDLVHFERIS